MNTDNMMIEKFKKIIGKNPLVFHFYQLFFRVLMEPLNRGFRLKYFFRYLNWFLLQKPRGKSVEIALFNGMKSLVYADSDSGVANIFSNNVDYHESAFVREKIRHGDYIVDAGCNVGNRTLVLADIASGGLLIDANPNCLTRARENFQLNNISLDNYHFLHSAVGCENSTVKFPADSGTSCQNRIGDDLDSENMIEVPLITIDTALEKIGCPAVSFLKTDLEGYDLDALRGAVNTLKSSSMRLVVFERWGTSKLEDFASFFEKIDWCIFTLDADGEPSVSPSLLMRANNLLATPYRLRSEIIGAQAG